MAVVALIYNKNGPVWIKGFIAAIVVSCVAGLLEVSLRVYLIFSFTNKQELKPTWLRESIETMSFFMSYLSWQLFFLYLILFTLFYWVNAKYNEHVVTYGTFNIESSGEDQRIIFVRRYSKITIVCTVVVFVGITIIFILKAAVP